jgi:hypothetical protein
VFGWLKRRLRREHRKLGWQNLRASHDPEMKILAGMYGDWDAFDGYDSARTFSEYFVEQLNGESDLTTDEIDAALKLNRGLRELYDRHGRSGRGGFDTLYRPLQGWAEYFKNQPNEEGILTQQREVNRSIEEFQKSGKLPF